MQTAGNHLHRIDYSIGEVSARRNLQPVPTMCRPETGSVIPPRYEPERWFWADYFSHALSHKLAREAVSAERLVRVPPDWSLRPMPVHAVMATRMQTASVRALVEFLAARLSLE